LERIFADGSQIYTRELDDGIPLKQFMVQVNLPKVAPLNMVHAAILHNRHVWDRNVINCQRIGTSGQNFDVIKITYGTLIKGVEKHAYVARRWSYGETYGGETICSLIERSIIPSGARMVEPRVNVYKSAFIIASTPDFIKISYCARIDLRGKISLWYNKVYGETLVEQMRRLRLYFTN